MKKKVGIGLVFVMVLSMCYGCGKKTSKYLVDVDYSDYVTVCDYKGVPASKVTFTVSEEEIQQRINDDLYAYVTYETITDRGAREGDYVNIDYKGSIDGVELAEYTESSMDMLLGEGYFFEEAEAAMVGMKAGDEKKLNIVLDEATAINEDEFGKTLALSITLNEISVEHLPEYNSDFVKTNMGFESTEAYEESLKAELENSKKEQYKTAAIEEILNYLYENSVFDKYPQELYDQCEEDFDTLNSQYAKEYEMELDEYLELYGIDEEIKEQILIEEVNYRMIIGAIAQAENIDCTEEEVEEFVQTHYEAYGYENATDFRQQYTDMQMGYEALFEKVTEFLYDNASLTTIDESEYMNQQMEEYDTDEEEIDFDETELVDDPIQEDAQQIEIIDDTEEIEDTEMLEETTSE